MRLQRGLDRGRLRDVATYARPVMVGTKRERFGVLRIYCEGKLTDAYPGMDGRLICSHCGKRVRCIHV